MHPRNPRNPRTLKKAAAAFGRYADTDCAKCIGCPICAEVRPTGCIAMGPGE